MFEIPVIFKMTANQSCINFSSVKNGFLTNMCVVNFHPAFFRATQRMNQSMRSPPEEKILSPPRKVPHYFHSLILPSKSLRELSQIGQRNFDPFPTGREKTFQNTKHFSGEYNCKYHLGHPLILTLLKVVLLIKNFGFAVISFPMTLLDNFGNRQLTEKEKKWISNLKKISWIIAVRSDFYSNNIFC
jgi:hypothetical protein